jgi:OOP family OmpA-OmpF porin
MIRFLAFWAVLVLVPFSAAAVELTLPTGARQLADRTVAFDTYALPTGVYKNGDLPTPQLEGRILTETWRISGATATTLQLLAPLRAQLEAQGFDLTFECEDRNCGGFDFRFLIDVVPAPDMFVDIRNFRFLSAVNAKKEAVGILVSPSGSAAYIQIINVVPLTEGSLVTTIAPTGVPSTGTPATSTLAQALLDAGHVVLPDLVFETGSTALGTRPYAALESLSGFLNSNRQFRVVLVGHTDATGDLGGNIDLSRQRAAAVRDRLIENYGVNPDQVEAQGMGYLAPVASNLTPEGREANRRVEAVLLPIP